MGGQMKDLEHIIEEAKKQGIDLSGNTDEMVAKFASPGSCRSAAPC